MIQHRGCCYIAESLLWKSFPQIFQEIIMKKDIHPSYGESIVRLRGGGDGPFRGMSFNAGMPELESMMDIGSVRVNLLF